MDTHPILITTFNNFGLNSRINPEQAKELTRAAERVNHKGFLRCAFPSRKGDEQLYELVDQYRDRFDPLAIPVINKWFMNHKVCIGDTRARLQLPR